MSKNYTIFCPKTKEPYAGDSKLAADELAPRFGTGSGYHSAAYLQHFHAFLISKSGGQGSEFIGGNGGAKVRAAWRPLVVGKAEGLGVVGWRYSAAPRQAQKPPWMADFEPRKG